MSSSEVEAPRKDKKEERRKKGGVERKGQRGRGQDVEQEEGEEEGTKRGSISRELKFMSVEEVHVPYICHNQYYLLPVCIQE